MKKILIFCSLMFLSFQEVFSSGVSLNNSSSLGALPDTKDSSEALKILNLSSSASFEEIKESCKKKFEKYTLQTVPDMIKLTKSLGDRLNRSFSSTKYATEWKIFYQDYDPDLLFKTSKPETLGALPDTKDSSEALKILNLSSSASFEEIKESCKKKFAEYQNQAISDMIKLTKSLADRLNRSFSSTKYATEWKIFYQDYDPDLLFKTSKPETLGALSSRQSVTS